MLKAYKALVSYILPTTVQYINLTITTMQNSPVQLKSAIIGKAWIPQGSTAILPANFVLPNDMTFAANESYLIAGMSFRTDRNLSVPVTVKAGEKLFFYTNSKRPGKQDPDFSVSVLLPTTEAETVINASKAGSEAWKATHPEVAA